MASLKLPPPGAEPITIVATRGPMTESKHMVSCAVVDTQGKLVAGWGDIEQRVYPRSAIKPLQALPLVESGAAEAFALNDQELTLACASHNGEAMHAVSVRGFLAKLGLGEQDLECGSHWPYDETSLHAMVVRGELPTPAHNNCSGKHAGMLATAQHLKEPVRGYIAAKHPVQQRVIKVLAEMAALDLARAPLGIDGCGIPTLALPLHNLAQAMARFAAPDDLAPERAAACRRLQRAITAAPLMLAGHNRLDSALVAASRGQIICKGGAEGVYTAALPERGLGIALKVWDGATRAREAALMAVLDWLEALDDASRQAAEPFGRPVIANRAGLAVGRVVPAAEAGF